MEQEKIEKISLALKGNKSALSLIENISYIVRIWDNLVDGDKPVTQDQVNRAFWVSLVEIPQNKFFKENQDQITTLFREYFNDWFDSNIFEKVGNDHQKTVSFVLRDMIGSIAFQFAYMIGGYDWMREVSPVLRSIQFDETLQNYMEGLKDGTI